MAIEFSHITIHCRIGGNLRMPRFAGSMLRGSFGHALKSLACTSPGTLCVDCSAKYHCVYSLLFESPAGKNAMGRQFNPHPIILKPPRKRFTLLRSGAPFVFDLLLLSPAQKHIPLIAEAWKLAGRFGLGFRRTSFTLQYIQDYISNRILWQSGTLMNRPETVALNGNLRPAGQPDLVLETQTPLRLIRKKQVLPMPAPEDIFTAVYRRMETLNEIYGTGDPILPEYSILNQVKNITSQALWRTRTLKRYSNRQKTSLPLDGVEGKMILKKVPPVLAGMLRYGEVFHIGKGASFGLGQYSVTPINDQEG